MWTLNRHIILLLPKPDYLGWSRVMLGCWWLASLHLHSVSSDYICLPGPQLIWGKIPTTCATALSMNDKYVNMWKCKYVFLCFLRKKSTARPGLNIPAAHLMSKVYQVRWWNASIVTRDILCCAVGSLVLRSGKFIESKNLTASCYPCNTSSLKLTNVLRRYKNENLFYNN